MRKMFKELKRVETLVGKDVMLNYASIVKLERMKGFETGTGPDGVKWRDLKAATVAAKQKKGYKNPKSPLRAKDYLMMPTISSTDGVGKVTLAKSRSAPVSGGMSISTLHDKGSGQRPPRRELLTAPGALDIPFPLLTRHELLIEVVTLIAALRYE